MAFTTPDFWKSGIISYNLLSEALKIGQSVVSQTQPHKKNLIDENESSYVSPK